MTDIRCLNKIKIAYYISQTLSKTITSSLLLEQIL
jgi:hypothetical protein